MNKYDYYFLKRAWHFYFRDFYRQYRKERVEIIEAFHRALKLADRRTWKEGNSIKANPAAIATILNNFTLNVMNWGGDDLRYRIDAMTYRKRIAKFSCRLP